MYPEELFPRRCWSYFLTSNAHIGGHIFSCLAAPHAPRYSLLTHYKVVVQKKIKTSIGIAKNRFR